MEYDQFYRWIIGFNDTEGNIGWSGEQIFTVKDTQIPTVVRSAAQQTATPEYDDYNNISIRVMEPDDASQIDMVWLNYTLDDWQSYTVVDISSTQTFNFTDTMLEYDQTYKWVIGYNDSAGNTDESAEFTFTVKDTQIPTVVRSAAQQTATPEYDDYNNVSISVMEPDNASQLDTVWLNYTLDDWLSFTIVDISSTQSFNFTDTMLEYDQTYKWVIWYNDTEGNTGWSLEFDFVVKDTQAPLVMRPADQLTVSPEYNDFNNISIRVMEPDDASQLDTVWLNYTLDDWLSFTIVDISSTQSFNFTDTMLEYDQTYKWVIGYNDTEGNIGWSADFNFLVIDSNKPDLIIPAAQNTSTPEYNETVIVSIYVEEPEDASQLDMVWLNYTLDDWQSFIVADITSTQSFNFTDTMLEYDQTYKWIIGYNDSAGNMGNSSEFSFTVIDSYAPHIELPAVQSTSTPEFNGSVISSIQIIEPTDASGLDTVWINYTIDNWLTYVIANISEFQTYTFIDSMLSYNQFYRWKIGFNDTTGNVDYSQELNFTVIDSYKPDILEIATQSTDNPEFNDSVISSISVFEPGDASGIDTIWINYTSTNWIIYTITNITSTQNFTFIEEMLKYGQFYKWYISFNDSAGNLGSSQELSFLVGDTSEPDVIIPATQNNSTPEYNESVEVSIYVDEPINASGLDTVWINFTIDLWETFTIVDITSTQSYIFTDAMLHYNQTYYWIIGYNDTASNTGFSDEFNFTVMDNYLPDIIVPAQQTTNYPEYDESNTISITLTEPSDASQVDKIVLCYKLNDDPWIETDISTTSSYTFSSEILRYSQIYEWYILFNDSAGNIANTTHQTFTVVDNTIPTYTNLVQTGPIIEYDGFNTLSVTITEPEDASGLITIRFYYRVNFQSYQWIDVTSTSTYTFTADDLSYGEIYDCFFWFNDMAGNSGQTSTKSFSVVDQTKPDFSDLNQTNQDPEYDDFNIVSINVTEPSDASGINAITLFYRINQTSWIEEDVTSTGRFNFTSEMLYYGQFIEFYFWFEDLVGNSNQTETLNFTINDQTPPTYTTLGQISITPEYNTNNSVFITVTEPLDASGVDTILLYYRIDNGQWVKENCTETGNYTFLEDELYYAQLYEWYFWFNDTVGNSDNSTHRIFNVADMISPQYSNLIQSNSSPNYDGNNTISINITEPIDASGVDTVWLNYTFDNWQTFTIIDITTTQNHTFDADQLYYGNWEWYILMNDSAGNVNQTFIQFFTVNDNISPTFDNLTQTNPIPNYNESNSISIDIVEPIDASGVDTILFYYHVIGANWIVVNVTDNPGFTFSDEMLNYSLIYEYYFMMNDSVGNINQTGIFSFNVVDEFAPDINEAASQSSNTPQFNESVTIRINVTEPVDGSGIDTVWINYTSNNWLTFFVVNITNSQEFIIDQNDLKYPQTYHWKIGYNDSAENTKFTEVFTFWVIDTYIPDIVTPASQSNTSPEYNETVVVSIYVEEPENASGLDTVWLNYTLDDWTTTVLVDITSTQTYNFMPEMLEFNQIFKWIINFNDSAGNRGMSGIFTFTVNDSYAPAVIAAPSQSTSSPEYNGTVDITIQVFEPTDASGIDTVWLNYTSDNWLTWDIINITSDEQHTFTHDLLEFNQIYYWMIVGLLCTRCTIRSITI
ncbi:MAG: hypothetical protein ACW964_01775 [Candidatus Hodarchaeales archaeon]